MNAPAPMLPRRPEVTAIQLLDFIKSHPDCPNAKIAAHFNLDASSVAARTGVLYKEGRVSRAVIGTTLSGVKKFGYKFVSYDKAKKPKKSKGTIPSTKRTYAEIHMEEAGHSITDDGLSQAPQSIHQSLVALSEALANAIVAQVSQKLAVELSSLSPEPMQAALPSLAEVVARVNTSKPALPAPKMKKVLVTGLTSQQAGVIASEFNDCFELKFWNDRLGDGMERLKTWAAASDVVLVHIGHSSHVTENVIPKDKLVRVNGGLTQMKEALTKLYVGA